MTAHQREEAVHVLYRESTRQRRFWSFLTILADGPVEIMGVFRSPADAWARVVELEPDLLNRTWREPGVFRSESDLYIDAEGAVYSLELHRVQGGVLA